MQVRLPKRVLQSAQPEQLSTEPKTWNSDVIPFLIPYHCSQFHLTKLVIKISLLSLQSCPDFASRYARSPRLLNLSIH
ncbi:hypothetical protein Hanom_Chr08g00759251 [Helianthus anomalus]